MRQSGTFIILGTNRDGQVQAFGTTTGKPFRSEDQAETKAKKLEKKILGADFIVLPIYELPEAAR